MSKYLALHIEPTGPALLYGEAMFFLPTQKCNKLLRHRILQVFIYASTYLSLICLEVTILLS